MVSNKYAPETDRIETDCISIVYRYADPRQEVSKQAAILPVSYADVHYSSPRKIRALFKTRREKPL